MIYYDTFDSPIGQLLATSDGENLTGIYMENHSGGPQIAADWQHEPRHFEAVKNQLDDYFAGTRTEFDLPLKLEGTPFQKSVWDELLAIPFGGTTTYGTLARKLGDKNASRAVGTAVGRNPISIIVPCHRVLGAGGAITGYAGGLDRKRTLLDLEAKALF